MLASGFVVNRIELELQFSYFLIIWRHGNKNPKQLLRRLHARPTQKAQAASIAAGTTGALTLGTGMSICLTEIGAALGSLSMVTGIAVGLAGLLLAALAYPLYNRVLKTQRAKIAPNILRISDELLQG